MRESPRSPDVLVRAAPEREGQAEAHRSSFRITSLRPDQTSLTAQTFTSTNPSGSATSLTVSSVMSVATFDAFFGQETQTAASGRISFLSLVSSWTSLDRLAVKTCTTSTFVDTFAANSTPDGSGSSSSA